ncbi:hypothetical protein HOD29_02510 [archaeon]|jgi:hypothetical protein|nr:hypothetical protein [archaeon]
MSQIVKLVKADDQGHFKTERGISIKRNQLIMADTVPIKVPVTSKLEGVKTVDDIIQGARFDEGVVPNFPAAYYVGEDFKRIVAIEKDPEDREKTIEKTYNVYSVIFFNVKSIKKKKL